MTERYWFINNSGMQGRFWDIFRWTIPGIAVLPLTALQAFAMTFAWSTPFAASPTWFVVLFLTCWELSIAAAMFHFSGSVIDVQADSEGITLTGIGGARKTVAWRDVGCVRVLAANSPGPYVVIYANSGRAQRRFCWGIYHPGPGTDAETFLLSKLAAFAPTRATVGQRPASWRDITVANAWFLGASLAGVAVSMTFGRYHLEPRALIPLPAAVLLTLVVRMRRSVHVEVASGVSPDWSRVPRSCRGWVKTLVSRADVKTT